MKLLLFFYLGIALLSLLLGCGADTKTQIVEVEKPVPGPGPGPGPEPDVLTWATVKPLTDQYCVRCHSNDRFLDSGDAFKNSRSYDLIFSGAMPPQGQPQPSEEDKTKMLRFLNS